MSTREDQLQDPRLSAIRAAIEPVLVAHGVELCGLAWTTAGTNGGGGLTLRLTIERPLPAGEPWSPEKGFGVTLDDCAEVSRDVSSTLDATDVVPHAYTLEVSSPGLDRPLHGAADFVRFQGAQAKAKLRVPAPDGQRVLRGTIAEASHERVAMIVDGKRIEVAAADVAEAQLVFELAAAPKKTNRVLRGTRTRATAEKPSAKRAAR